MLSRPWRHAAAFAVLLGLFVPRPLLAAELTAGAVVGSVVTTDGRPIAGADVVATAPAGRYSTHTDTRGRFTLLGIVADTYVVTVTAASFEPAVRNDVLILPGAEARASFALQSTTRTIGVVRTRDEAFVPGATSDTFRVGGAAAQARAPVTSPAGLAAYTQGTVQGAIANVPGVDLDPFGNAILRAGRVGDTVFEYDSVPLPQGLIAEPGGNVAGAQLPTTGVASTNVTLAGYSSESENALGGIVNQIAATGTYPSRTTIDLADGFGTSNQLGTVQFLGATPDLKWRYAFAATSGSETFAYGDGHSFYPAEAGTYGLALQSRAQFSVEANVHDRLSPTDDLSILAIFGGAQYDQYGSPFAGETVGQFDGVTTRYPGESDPQTPVLYASGVRGSFNVVFAAWQHVAANVVSRVQLDESRYGSSAGGPFWDENGFPDGSISLAETSFQQRYGASVDTEAILGPHRLRAGATYRTDTSYLDQVVPTADEFITSHPTVQSMLFYVSDTWTASSRLEITATARGTTAHFSPSVGTSYGTGAIDPHAGVAYRLGANLALRANIDRITVAPAPLEAERIDSADVQDGVAPPFVQLHPESATDQTYALEGGGRTQFRLTYYRKFEQNLIDVLPYDFRSATAAGTAPNGIGVPTNVGDLRADGFELYLRHGGVRVNANLSHAFSSSASQFAYNDLNAPAIAAGHLFPVSYQPEFTAELSYEFDLARRCVRITPSLSYSSGYPYGNGKMVYVFDPATGKPVHVPNDNYVNPGANYYFLKDPSQPFDAVTNPYIGNLGTNEGDDPNTLRSAPQALVNLHVEGDISPRLSVIVDVANLFGTSSPTALQNNPYLIGPPGYAGGNAAYAACYGKILAGVPCSTSGPAATPYVLGNGVPTNDGVSQSVPWTYGSAGYVAQSYPLARTVQLRLRYRL